MGGDFQYFHKPFLLYWERSHPGLSQLDSWHDRQRAPLQDGDHSGNDPHLVPGFLCQRSGLLPERFGRMSVSLGSEEIRLTWTVHPSCGRDSVLLNSCDSFFSNASLNLLGNLCYILLRDSGEADFWVWLFLRYSCVSLAIARHFFLFFKVAITLEEGKTSTVVKTELCCLSKNFQHN